MTKRTRKTLTMLLSALLALAMLAACGGKSPAPAPGAETTAAATTTAKAAETTTAATTAATTAETTTAAKVTDKPVVDKAAPTQVKEKEAEKTVSKYQQSPMLDKMNLPPVDERLPANPLVIKPYESTGTYGGNWNMAVILGNSQHCKAGLGEYEGRGFLLWNQELTEIVPNLATNVTMSDDGKTFTITLREGLKWSDGAPMTSDDALFWFEARESNKDVNPGWENASLKVEKLEVVDETTFKIIYNKSNPLYMYDIAGFQWNAQFLPKHYLAQFHKDYANDAEDKAKAAGFDGWVKYFQDRYDWQFNNELPTMAPFVLETDAKAATTLHYARNPYYWAVDDKGNQLPYIDTLTINIVESPDLALMRAAAGDIDMQMATLTEDFNNYPFLAENAAAGGYEVRMWDYGEPGAMNIFFNMAHKDPVVRDILKTSEFRHAMSYALNREAIIATYLTVGPISSTPRNSCPPANSQFYDPAWAKMNIEFDQDKANEILDNLGLNARNESGIRLLPNGEPFRLTILVPNYVDNWIDIGLAYADAFTAVGVETSATSLDPPLWGERIRANDFDVSIQTAGCSMLTLSLGQVHELTGFNTWWAWGNTYQAGYILQRASGQVDMEVPDDIQQLWELGAKIVVEVDEAKRMDLINQAFQLHKDNLYALNVGTRLPGMYIVKNNVKNVPPLAGDWEFGVGGHGRPSQYYFK